MNINIICHSKSRNSRHIKSAVDLLNSVQNQFNFNLMTQGTDIVEEDQVNWKKFCETYIVENNQYNLFITDKKFDDNWFSHEDDQFGIISIFDWETHYAPPSLKSYIMYQIAQATINFSANLRELLSLRMVHKEAEGCMFDFCEYKNEIKYGMRTGIICPKCKASLHQLGINNDVIYAAERMLQLVRTEAIGTPIRIKPNSAFIVMKYTTHDENDNSYRHGIKLALDELNIECVRADSIMNSAQLLRNVLLGIEQSPFVIVKVDTDNLNVYFELGYAMGLNKTILLVCEESVVLNLPADIRGIICLTYKKGDYDGLKDTIKQYFKNNYHY